MDATSTRHYFRFRRLFQAQHAFAEHTDVTVTLFGYGWSCSQRNACRWRGACLWDTDNLPWRSAGLLMVHKRAAPLFLHITPALTRQAVSPSIFMKVYPTDLMDAGCCRTAWWSPLLLDNRAFGELSHFVKLVNARPTPPQRQKRVILQCVDAVCRLAAVQRADGGRVFVAVNFSMQSFELTFAAAVRFMRRKTAAGILAPTCNDTCPPWTPRHHLKPIPTASGAISHAAPGPDAVWLVVTVPNIPVRGFAECASSQADCASAA